MWTSTSRARTAFRPVEAGGEVPARDGSYGEPPLQTAAQAFSPATHPAAPARSAVAQSPRHTRRSGGRTHRRLHRRAGRFVLFPHRSSCSPQASMQGVLPSHVCRHDTRASIRQASTASRKVKRHCLAHSALKRLVASSLQASLQASRVICATATQTPPCERHPLLQWSAAAVPAKARVTSRHAVQRASRRSRGMDDAAIWDFLLRGRRPPPASTPVGSLTAIRRGRCLGVTS